MFVTWDSVLAQFEVDAKDCETRDFAYTCWYIHENLIPISVIVIIDWIRVLADLQVYGDLGALYIVLQKEIEC